MSENTRYWAKLARPPVQALRSISGGRLRGMTDINPQWRLQAMTENFGPCGIGWKYTIDNTWTEAGASEEIMVFVSVSVYIKDGDNWSDAIPGIGGNKLIEKERNGLHNSDEGYKMALTDALGVAFKALGVAADIYAGMWTGSKYARPPAFEEKPPPKSPSEAAQIAQRIKAAKTADEYDTLLKDVNAVRGKASMKEHMRLVELLNELGERIEAERAAE